MKVILPQKVESPARASTSEEVPVALRESSAYIGIPSRATLASDIEAVEAGCRIAGSGDRAAGDLTVVSRGLIFLRKKVSGAVDRHDGTTTRHRTPETLPAALPPRAQLARADRRLLLLYDQLPAPSSLTALPWRAAA